jgi:hypothetical protein
MSTENQTTEAVLVPQDKPTLSVQEVAKEVSKSLTAAQARVQEVTDALAPAYARASTLELTDAEIEALTAPFPDSAVEIRPHDGLSYIPHIHISNRLNAVIKPGRWAIVCRRHWMADNVMYGEYVLLVRGCYVGEAVGGHPYVPSNPKTNYSDALESTRAEALRRICGKSLGVGAQVWDPEYSRNWQSTYAHQQNGKWYKHLKPSNLPQESSPSPASPTPQRSGAVPSPAAAGTNLPKGTVSRPRVEPPQSPSSHLGVAAGTPPPEDLNALADDANASRTRQVAQTQPSPAQPAKVAPSPKSAPTTPGPNDCPKCRSTATKASADYDKIRWCQRCGWQWNEHGKYWEPHAWATIICTIPPKGLPKAEYQKAPQTLGQIARIDSPRWYGLIMNNSEEKSRKGYTNPAGKHYPATMGEVAFGKACDEARAYTEAKNAEKAAETEEPEEPEPTVPF